MRILVVCDSFKGTLSSSQVGRIIQEELSAWHQVDYLPVSDGGEGFLEAWQGFFPGEVRTILCPDPLSREITGTYLLSADQTALLESALAAGLGLLAEQEKDPFKASTFGLGLMVRDALHQGALMVVIGLGGVATNDGGTGLLQALGLQFLDSDHQVIRETGGALLNRIADIDTSKLDPLVRQATFVGVCDVDNPLLGPRGTSQVYGPQKGAGPDRIESLERGMDRYARMVIRKTGEDHTQVPGAGAAGGLGFCLKSFFQARLVRGIDALAEITGLEERISQYDLLITGEGKLDNQTKSGKVPVGILRIGQKHHKPVICVCGQHNQILNPGFSRILSVVPRHASLQQSIRSPESSLRRLIAEELSACL